MDTGSKIKKARLDAGLTQKQLAEKLKIPYQSIGQWERNIRKPKPQSLYKLAKAIGVQLEDLYDDHIVEQSLLEPTIGRLLLGAESGFVFVEDGIISSVQITMGKKGKEDGKLIKSIVETSNALNQLGKKEAIKRMSELSEIPRYRAENTTEQPDDK